MKNLRQRVDRHLRLATFKDKSKLRWHIDYLLTHDNIDISRVEYFRSVKKEECKINQKLLKLTNAVIPVKGFGSSDCKICESHLIMLK
jgi:Uri superfamily endonuclease